MCIRHHRAGEIPATSCIVVHGIGAFEAAAGDCPIITIETVIAVLLSAQEAWNSGSVDGVLDKYVDDVIYTTNAGGPNGEPLTIRGKERLRLRFQKAMDVIESQASLRSVRCEDDLVRTRLAAHMRHRATGHCLNLTLRQVIRFRGFRLAEIQDFHDAARLAAFWRLVGDSLAQAHDPVPVKRGSIGEKDKAPI